VVNGESQRLAHTQLPVDLELELDSVGLEPIDGDLFQGARAGIAVIIAKPESANREGAT
jgi:hypothetical protein